MTCLNDTDEPTNETDESPIDNTNELTNIDTQYESDRELFNNSSHELSLQSNSDSSSDETVAYGLNDPSLKRRPKRSKRLPATLKDFIVDTATK